MSGKHTPWKPIDTVARDGSWVIMANLDDDGNVTLAHIDAVVVEVDDWYLNADPSIFAHWTHFDIQLLAEMARLIRERLRQVEAGEVQRTALDDNFAAVLDKAGVAE